MSKSQKLFEKTDFKRSTPQKWNPSHSRNAASFRCVYPIFAKHFKVLIPNEDGEQISRCWVIIEDNRLASYITLQADRLEFRDIGGKKKTIATTGGDFKSFPAIRISLLAADKRSKAAGKRLVQWSLGHIIQAVAPHIGARFIKVDAYYDKDAKDSKGNPEPYDASLFYRKLGFEYANPDQQLPLAEPYRSMYLDLKPLMDKIAAIE